MAFSDLVTAAQTYFPKLQVKYKDQSAFMKFLSVILFFSPSFMTDYTTTIGNTIYFPSQAKVKLHPVTYAVVLMHETVHMYDEQRLGTLRFQLTYLLPQLLAIPAALLFFVVSWPWALFWVLFFLAPTPAYWRMIYERRAYYSSFYTLQKLGVKLNFDPQLPLQSTTFVQYFVNSSYYYMWPFKSILTDDFNQALANVQAGKRPYEDPVFDMLDDLVTKL